MSVQSQIDRIKTDVENAYEAVEERRDLSNLANSIGSLPVAIPLNDLGDATPEDVASGKTFTSASGISVTGTYEPYQPSAPADPVDVYNTTRPADWIAMPTPADNELYLLVHIPNGGASLLAFTVTTDDGGSYSVYDGHNTVTKTSGSTYETELDADLYDDLTSTGMKQAMIKISTSGSTNILTWESSLHSKKTYPDDYKLWSVVEISGKLPEATRVVCGGAKYVSALAGLRYFSLYGSNKIENASNMFEYCSSLVTVPSLDTSNVTSMSRMFIYCQCLVTAPSLDTSNVTSMESMFYGCYELSAFPLWNTSNVTNMKSMFQNCYSLSTISPLDTSNVTTTSSMFSFCRTLKTVPPLDTSNNTNMSSMFNKCYMLGHVSLVPTVSDWSGTDIEVAYTTLSHKAIVDLFNSLPTITQSHSIALYSNIGISELTEEDKAIATNKNWTVVF